MFDRLGPEVPSPVLTAFRSEPSLTHMLRFPPATPKFARVGHAARQTPSVSGASLHRFPAHGVPSLRTTASPASDGRAASVAASGGPRAWAHTLVEGRPPRPAVCGHALRGEREAGIGAEGRGSRWGGGEEEETAEPGRCRMRGFWKPLPPLEKLHIPVTTLASPGRGVYYWMQSRGGAELCVGTGLTRGDWTEEAETGKETGGGCSGQSL